MALRFEQELDLQMAACEFGLPVPEFTERLARSDAMARSFGALRTAGGTIKRDVFATMFGRAAIEFRLTIEGSVSISRGVGSSIKSKFKDAGKVGEVRRFGDLGWGVESLAFSPDGSYLAAGKMDDAVLVFDVNKSARIVGLPKLNTLGNVLGCAYTPDGTRFLTSGGQGLVLVWEVNKNGQLKPLSQFAGHSKGVSSLAISADSRLVLSGGDERKVRLWKLDDCKELGVFAGFEGKVKACHISSNGRIGWATDGGTLLQIDLQKREVTKRTPLTRSWASGQAAAISPDEKYVAAGDGYDIRVWELETGRELPRLEGDEIQWGTTFTPDGTRLVSGGNGKIDIWNMKNQHKIGSLPIGMHVYVKCIATASDNKHVAAIGSSAGQAIQVLRIPDAEK